MPRDCYEETTSDPTLSEHPADQDLMIGRITLHQKTIWMLKSFLKA
jgi:DNA-binding ferritin-like protein